MISVSGPGALLLLRFLRLRAEHPQSISRRNRSSSKVVELNELSWNAPQPGEHGFDALQNRHSLRKPPEGRHLTVSQQWHEFAVARYIER